MNNGAFMDLCILDIEAIRVFGRYPDSFLVVIISGGVISDMVSTLVFRAELCYSILFHESHALLSLLL